MAAPMFTLLFTGFLPKIGVEFDWVTYHWIAGVVLDDVHRVPRDPCVLLARFLGNLAGPDRPPGCMATRVRRFVGLSAPPPRRFAKYPLENKGYHAAIIATGLLSIVTGLFMLVRVRTPVVPARSLSLQRPDVGAGCTCCTDSPGVGLIALVMVHVYFVGAAREAGHHHVDDFRVDEP